MIGVNLSAFIDLNQIPCCPRMSELGSCVTSAVRLRRCAHGTNEPSTIGKYVSSGCVRLMNEELVE